MAKKTRARKIATSERRQNSSENDQTRVTSLSSHSTLSPETPQDKEIKKYFFLDLKKSFIVVLLILGFELILYYL